MRYLPLYLERYARELKRNFPESTDKYIQEKYNLAKLETNEALENYLKKAVSKEQFDIYVANFIAQKSFSNLLALVKIIWNWLWSFVLFTEAFNARIKLWQCCQAEASLKKEYINKRDSTQHEINSIILDKKRPTSKCTLHVKHILEISSVPTINALNVKELQNGSSKIHKEFFLVYIEDTKKWYFVGENAVGKKMIDYVESIKELKDLYLKIEKQVPADIKNTRNLCGVVQKCLGFEEKIQIFLDYLENYYGFWDLYFFEIYNELGDKISWNVRKKTWVWVKEKSRYELQVNDVLEGDIKCKMSRINEYLKGINDINNWDSKHKVTLESILSEEHRSDNKKNAFIILKLLQKHNINHKDELGNTALHYAALAGNYTLIDFLTRSGCKILRNKYGKTAFDYLNLEQKSELLKWIPNNEIILNRLLGQHCYHNKKWAGGRFPAHNSLATEYDFENPDNKKVLDEVDILSGIPVPMSNGLGSN